MRSRCWVFFFFFWCAMLLLLQAPPCNCAKHSDPPGLFLHSSKEGLNQSRAEARASKMAVFSHRRLVLHGSSSECTNRDISISQSRDSSSSGIPQFIVQIVNTCAAPRCSPSGIHLHCGWFASARVVNPRRFKRLSYDDCLVNGGEALNPSQIVRFTYSNSFMYPLVFKYAKFC
ncbi:TPD1 protein homolog 1-like [Rhodamnia argentea]|uniref:TPD1 protein homolog 1-like n=1 Tax=Rhodamnia argentea TaxID=178133 RepID=A0A8B8PYI9_9MYRT|nr:TPD1 protein homolog 1-like [Rhodamnia argentea]